MSTGKIDLSNKSLVNDMRGTHFLLGNDKIMKIPETNRVIEVDNEKIKEKEELRSYLKNHHYKIGNYTNVTNSGTSTPKSVK
jgi:hypothetical protein